MLNCLTYIYRVLDGGRTFQRKSYQKEQHSGCRNPILINTTVSTQSYHTHVCPHIDSSSNLLTQLYYRIIKNFHYLVYSPHSLFYLKLTKFDILFHTYDALLIFLHPRGYHNTTQVLNALFAAGVYDKRIRPYHEGTPALFRTSFKAVVVPPPYAKKLSLVP